MFCDSGMTLAMSCSKELPVNINTSFARELILLRYFFKDGDIFDALLLSAVNLEIPVHFIDTVRINEYIAMVNLFNKSNFLILQI